MPLVSNWSQPSDYSSFHARRGGPVWAPAAEQGASGRPTASVSTATRVLVVEDDFLISMSVEDALTEAGFEVVGVSRTAEEAVAAAAEARPALVVMDIRLAGKRDGIDAAQEIYRRFGVRSIFATAHADAEIQARALAAAPLGWLQKPYSTQALIELVRQAAAGL